MLYKKYVAIPLLAIFVCYVHANDSIHEMASDKCEALQRSDAMIRFILDDVMQTYDWFAPGGISAIEQQQTDTYIIHIPQEERIDTITYGLTADNDCHVTIRNKATGAISF